MADIYAEANLHTYTYNNHTWYEPMEHVHVSQSGQGGFEQGNGTGAFMVLPGSGATAVKCYTDVYICIRVNDELDAYLKIAPGSEIRDGCRGIYYPAVVRGTCTGIDSYRSVMVTYPHDFRLISDKGNNTLKMTDASSNRNTIVSDIIYGTIGNYPVHRVYKRSPESSMYGSYSVVSTGQRYHWQIGYGNAAGSQDMNARYDSSGNLTNAWISSAGWFYCGNLEDDFDWDEDEENFDGYVYVGGSAYYNSVTTNAIESIPVKVTIPGLRRLLTYYPWAIYKSGTWMSCNRAAGYLKRLESGSWEDEKNLP